MGKRVRTQESGTATAEYVTGSLGAILFAVVLYRLSAGEGSFFQDLIESIMSHVHVVITQLFNLGTKIG